MFTAAYRGIKAVAPRDQSDRAVAASMRDIKLNDSELKRAQDILLVNHHDDPSFQQAALSSMSQEVKSVLPNDSHVSVFYAALKVALDSGLGWQDRLLALFKSVSTKYSNLLPAISSGMEFYWRQNPNRAKLINVICNKFLSGVMETTTLDSKDDVAAWKIAMERLVQWLPHSPQTIPLDRTPKYEIYLAIVRELSSKSLVLKNFVSMLSFVDNEYYNLILSKLARGFQEEVKKKIAELQKTIAGQVAANIVDEKISKHDEEAKKIAIAEEKRKKTEAEAISASLGQSVSGSVTLLSQLAQTADKKLESHLKKLMTELEVRKRELLASPYMTSMPEQLLYFDSNEEDKETFLDSYSFSLEQYRNLASRFLPLEMLADINESTWKENSEVLRTITSLAIWLQMTRDCNEVVAQQLNQANKDAFFKSLRDSLTPENLYALLRRMAAVRPAIELQGAFIDHFTSLVPQSLSQAAIVVSSPEEEKKKRDDDRAASEAAISVVMEQKVKEEQQKRELEALRQRTFAQKIQKIQNEDKNVVEKLQAQISASFDRGFAVEEKEDFNFFSPVRRDPSSYSLILPKKVEILLQNSSCTVREGQSIIPGADRLFIRYTNSSLSQFLSALSQKDQKLDSSDSNIALVRNHLWRNVLEVAQDHFSRYLNLFSNQNWYLIELLNYLQRGQFEDDVGNALAEANGNFDAFRKMLDEKLIAAMTQNITKAAKRGQQEEEKKQQQSQAVTLSEETKKGVVDKIGIQLMRLEALIYAPNEQKHGLVSANLQSTLFSNVDEHLYWKLAKEVLYEAKLTEVEANNVAQCYASSDIATTAVKHLVEQQLIYNILNAIDSIDWEHVASDRLQAILSAPEFLQQIHTALLSSEVSSSKTPYAVFAAQVNTIISRAVAEANRPAEEERKKQEALRAAEEERRQQAIKIAEAQAKEKEAKDKEAKEKEIKDQEAKKQHFIEEATNLFTQTVIKPTADDIATPESFVRYLNRFGALQKYAQVYATPNTDEWRALETLRTSWFTADQQNRMTVSRLTAELKATQQQRLNEQKDRKSEEEKKIHQAEGPVIAPSSPPHVLGLGEQQPPSPPSTISVRVASLEESDQKPLLSPTDAAPKPSSGRDWRAIIGTVLIVGALIGVSLIAIFAPELLAVAALVAAAMYVGGIYSIGSSKFWDNLKKSKSLVGATVLVVLGIVGCVMLGALCPLLLLIKPAIAAMGSLGLTSTAAAAGGAGGAGLVFGAFGVSQLSDEQKHRAQHWNNLEAGALRLKTNIEQTYMRSGQQMDISAIYQYLNTLDNNNVKILHHFYPDFLTTQFRFDREGRVSRKDTTDISGGEFRDLSRADTVIDLPGSAERPRSSSTGSESSDDEEIMTLGTPLVT